MIKRLAKCVKEYKLFAILSPILVAIESIIDMFIPLLMANLIDEGISCGNKEKIIFYGVILVFIALLAMFFGIVSGICASKASAGFAKNIRKEMFYNVQNFSFENIDKFSTASIITRHTTDIMNVQMAFQMIIRMAMRSPTMLFCSLLFAALINVKIALLFLCVTPVLGIGLILIATKAHPIFEKTFKIYDKLNRIVEENIRGIRVVKSFVTEDKEIEKFEDVSSDIYKNFSKAEKLVALNSPLMQTCINIVLVLIALIGGKMIMVNELTTGELTSMITYAMQVLTSLMMLSFVFVMVMISRPSAERIVEILNEKPTIVSKENAIKDIKDGSIKFTNVDFSYVNDESKLALKNINIEIKSGETIGIIGGTGSSKSTFVQLIPRLYDATSGTVSVGGIDVKDYDLKSLRDNVAMVLQKNVLFSGTIRENLLWGNPNATEEEIIKACKDSQAYEFIKNLPDGLDTYLEEGGTNVSGGQKQRLCIARALLKNPKILILDDSTSAVDTKTDSLIRNAFAEDIPNTTKLIIAQRIASVQDADKIIVFDNGAINDFGTHDELVSRNHIYKEVYESQMKGGDE